MWAWLWGRGRAVTREVVLYTREGCHLCDDAKEVLAQARQRFAFTLTTIDIDQEPPLVVQFGECVPVVTVDGKVRFRGRVNPVLLTRLLRAGD